MDPWTRDPDATVVECVETLKEVAVEVAVPMALLKNQADGCGSKKCRQFVEMKKKKRWTAMETALITRADDWWRFTSKMDCKSNESFGNKR